MNKEGPIIVLEDDKDDQLILAEAFSELDFPNEIVFFSDGIAALAYLKADNIYPFLILSDVNMPRLSGFELKKKVHTNEDLSQKCIPYLFFTTSADKRAVCQAYTMSAQGFFVKPTNFDYLKTMLRKIIEYWLECYSPNSFGIRD